MKIRHVVIATAALAFGPAAFAQEAPQAADDCATLQAQFDQHAAAATAEQLTFSIQDTPAGATPLRAPSSSNGKALSRSPAQ